MTKAKLEGALKARDATIAERDAAIQGLSAEIERLCDELASANSTVRGALANHLEAQGCADAEAEADRVLVHLVDVARHSTRFPEHTVRALMALAE